MRRSVHAGLWLSALLTGFYQFFHLVGTGYGRGFEMAAIARSLAQYGTFGNPFLPAITGPTALAPPLYPLFLAALIKVSGSLIWMALAAAGVNIFANALIAGLMPRLSEAFFGDWIPGAFAGALWIPAMRLMPQWDATCTIAGLLVFCLATDKTIGRRDHPVLWAAVAGVLGGLLSLLNPATLIVFLPWVGFLLFRRMGPRYATRYGATMLLAIAVCNAPWVLRNYRIWHAFVVKANFGITFYSSNNDCAESSLVKEGLNGCFQKTNPVASQAEVDLLRQMGEVQYDRNRTRAAWNWIHANPGRFWQLTRARIFEFWFPEPIVPAYTAYGIWAITVLSIPGILLMMRRKLPITLFVLAVWVLYPVMYYVVISCDRYRYPILWTSMLPAGYCLAVLMPRWKRASAYPASSREAQTIG